MAVIISWIKSYSSLNDGEILSGQDIGDIQTAINNHDHTFSTGSFLALSDTPNSYGGTANNFVKVNPSETALIFSSAALNLATEVVGVLPVANGGTGANDAATARANLGLTVGTNVLSPTGDGSGLTGITHASAGYNTGTYNNYQYVTVTVVSVTKTLTAGRSVLVLATGWLQMNNSNGSSYSILTLGGNGVIQTEEVRNYNDNKMSFALSGIQTGLSGSYTFTLSVVGSGGAGQFNGTAHANMTVLEF